ncbi:Uncharacterised protein [Klebsiella michiganensis]|uniref:Uncharacterized protein n=1 Tax=Klebsiella michiganensis TaxID=1134687 RepID=A0A7H4N1Z5_9ENTR|nr:Uncharacterised protein [Klebsiella michiganensis]
MSKINASFAQAESRRDVDAAAGRPGYSFLGEGAEAGGGADALVAGDPAVGRAAQEDADKPAKVSHFRAGPE